MLPCSGILYIFWKVGKQQQFLIIILIKRCSLTWVKLTALYKDLMAKTTSTYISNKQNLKYYILATIITYQTITMLHTHATCAHQSPLVHSVQKLIINILSYVCAFLRVAGSEFQRDGAMKLKECCPNDLSFRFGILSSFSLEDVKHQLTYLFIRRPDESETVRKCREIKKDKEVKTLQNGGKQFKLQSCTGSRILWVASEIPWEVVLRGLVFFFHHKLCCIILHPIQPSDLVCW